MVTGFALVSLPFLLCEMSNGISEVIAIHWIPWTLAAAHRAWRSPTHKHWMQVGLLFGLAAAANFYYGLVTALVLGVGSRPRDPDASRRGSTHATAFGWTCTRHWHWRALLFLFGWLSMVLAQCECIDCSTQRIRRRLGAESQCCRPANLLHPWFVPVCRFIDLWRSLCTHRISSMDGVGLGRGGCVEQCANASVVVGGIGLVDRWSGPHFILG